jgi:hypothetical protein
MHKEAAVRPADVPVRVAAVDSQVAPDLGADPAPAELSVGQACRQSVGQDLVFRAECRAFQFQVCPLEFVPVARLAPRALAPLPHPANLELPRWQTARSRSQDAKN